MDLRLKFGLGAAASGHRSCIVVLESNHTDRDFQMGVAVDAVSEVKTLRSSQIDPTPRFGAGIDTLHIQAMAKAKDEICMLLDIDHVLREEDRLGGLVSPTDTVHAA